MAANRAVPQAAGGGPDRVEQGSVSPTNGEITIDLSQVEVQAKKKLDAQGITVFDKVPAVKGLNFVLFQSDTLVKVQRLIKLLEQPGPSSCPS